ncbi:hypothetical protein [Planctomonas psychrotolerans]|uniref:hypothetical protein n=1 Tax=Planctomonas psychrotolerans TaxID=2528712 RepID=UPI001238BB6E|nr:hypothetical protein [Planctomonas psychrotolerans]
MRAATSIVLATLILGGTTGCNFISPQTTNEFYHPAEGYNFEFGDVLARNVTLLSEEGERASLIATFVNRSDESQNVIVQYDASGGRITQEIAIAEGITIYDGSDESRTIVLEDIDDARPGSLFPLYMQYGDVEGIEARVPVFDDTFEHYEGLLPSPAPSIDPEPSGPTDEEPPADTLDGRSESTDVSETPDVSDTQPDTGTPAP